MGGMPARASRILIVDDQPVFRSAARTLLAARGYTVVGEADCARSALEAADRLAPDGVLLDVCLGAECGLDVAHALTGAQPSLAVVLRLRRSARTRARNGCARCGARAFVLQVRARRHGSLRLLALSRVGASPDPGDAVRPRRRSTLRGSCAPAE